MFDIWWDAEEWVNLKIEKKKKTNQNVVEWHGWWLVGKKEKKSK